MNGVTIIILQKWAQKKHLSQVTKAAIDIGSRLAEPESLSKHQVGDHVVCEILTPHGKITHLAGLREFLVKSRDKIFDYRVEILFIG